MHYIYLYYVNVIIPVAELVGIVNKMVVDWSLRAVVVAAVMLQMIHLNHSLTLMIK